MLQTFGKLGYSNTTKRKPVFPGCEPDTAFSNISWYLVMFPTQSIIFFVFFPQALLGLVPKMARRRFWGRSEALLFSGQEQALVRWHWIFHGGCVWTWDKPHDREKMRKKTLELEVYCQTHPHQLYLTDESVPEAFATVLVSTSGLLVKVGQELSLVVSGILWPSRNCWQPLKILKDRSLGVN